MAKMTIAQRLAYGLEVLGSKELPKRGKYRVFTRFEKDYLGDDKYFIGPSGALRLGRAPSNSVSISEGQLHKKILACIGEDGPSIQEKQS